MKLSITNPEVVDALVDSPGGLWPTRRGGDLRMLLIVKGSQEMARTAKLRKGFRFYMVPVRVSNITTFGLVTAFFDDDDEPLTIRTPLLNEEITRDFLVLLSSDSFHVHFFDEHNRELLGFRADNPDAHRFRGFADTIRFVPPSLAHGRQLLDGMQLWFSARSPSDDAAAFDIHMREQMFPDRLAEYVDNPGDFNEPDIAAALRSTFRSDQVLSNPIRADNNREFADVLVITDKTLLLIQAKDSPITESALTRTLIRKQAVAVKHVGKAAGQLKGTINHLKSNQSIEVFTDGKSRNVSMSGRDVFGMVIVKEVFDPDRPDCSPLVLSVSKETGIPCLLLDHSEFQQLTFFQSTEEWLVRSLREIFAVADQRGVFPRSRFGMRVGKSVVYEPAADGEVSDSTSHEPARSFEEGSQAAAASVSGSSVTAVTPGTEFREGVDADWLRVVVYRAEVEAIDVSRTAAVLSRVLADRSAVQRYRGRVDLSFHGYSEDPRELYEIPEVRRFCKKLDEAFPYWFYFLSTDRVILRVVACCLCSVTKPMLGVVSFGPDLIEFMTLHFQALNWIFQNYSLDYRHNVEISRMVTEYFTMPEPET